MASAVLLPFGAIAALALTVALVVAQVVVKSSL
jgi:hypothetical protein